MLLAALVNDDVNQQFPRWDNLPSKILCRVANIQLLVLYSQLELSLIIFNHLAIVILQYLVNLQAERETDKAYARITFDLISNVRNINFICLFIV